jgi:hypothetical protein
MEPALPVRPPVLQNILVKLLEIRGKVKIGLVHGR